MSNEVKTSTKKDAIDISLLITFIRIIRRNIISVILVFISVVACFTVFSAIKCKTVYTATEKVIFITNVASSQNPSHNKSSDVQSDVSLAILYLPQVKSIIANNNGFIEYANNFYSGDGHIESGAIGIEYGESSLIFSISYTDYSEKLAREKLISLVDSASKFLSPTGEGSSLIQAKEIGLKKVQSEPTVTSKNNFIKFELVGVLVGVALAVGVALLLNALNNTIYKEEDLEEITGVGVLSYIEFVD